MNDKQRNKLAMLKATRDYLAAENAVWDDIAANVAAHDALTSKIVDIDGAATAQGAATTGYTATKNTLREALKAQILLVANATAAYARVAGNEVLLAEVKLTPSELDNTSDQFIDDTGTRVANAATGVLASLADYGITAPDIAALEAAITAFDTAKPAGAVKRAQRAGLTAALEPMLAEAMSIVKDRLDPLMARYKTAHPSFHAGYEAARVIIDLHGPGNGGEDEEDDDPPPPGP